MTETKYEFIINSDFTAQFKKDIANLIKIDKKVKIKIQNDYVLMYAVAGESRSPFALKYYLYDKNEIFSKYPDDVVDYINVNSTNLSKSLNVLGDDIKLTLNKYDAEKCAHEIVLESGKIKLNFLGGRYLELKDYTLNEFESVFDLDNANEVFNITKEQFVEIKKLSQLNKGDDDEASVNIRVNNGKYEFFDLRWNIEIGDSENDSENDEWYFDYKYLKSISNDDMTFYIFDAFVIIKQNNETLMIALQIGL